MRSGTRRLPARLLAAATVTVVAATTVAVALPVVAPQATPGHLVREVLPLSGRRSARPRRGGGRPRSQRRQGGTPDGGRRVVGGRRRSRRDADGRPHVGRLARWGRADPLPGSGDRRVVRLDRRRQRTRRGSRQRRQRPQRRRAVVARPRRHDRRPGEGGEGRPHRSATRCEPLGAADRWRSDRGRRAGRAGDARAQRVGTGRLAQRHRRAAGRPPTSCPSCGSPSCTTR